MTGHAMPNRVTTLAARVALAVLAIALAGCNTIAGVGKDVKAGGQAIESAAEKSKSK